MLSGNFQKQNHHEVLPRPSYAHTAYQSSEEPFLEVYGALGAIPGLQSEETRRSTKEALDVIQNTLNDPRVSRTQSIFSTVASMVPMVVATGPVGEVGGMLARPGIELAASGLAKLAPEAALSLARKPIASLTTSALTDYLPQATVSAFTKGTAQQLIAYKAAMFPSHLMANYDKDKDVYNLKEAATETLNDNWGFLIPASLVAGGWLAHRALKVRSNALKTQGIVDTIAQDAKLRQVERQKAILAVRSKSESILLQDSHERATLAEHEEENGRRREAANMAHSRGELSDAEHQYLHDYITNPDHEELPKRAFDILKDQQLPIDRATGRVWFQILGKDDIKNLNTQVADQIASNVSKENQKALSNYIIQNRYDAVRANMIDNPAMLYGLKGYSEYVDKKLMGRRAKLAEFDTTLDEHLPKGFKGKEMFSQQKIYNHLKRKGILDAESVPYSVPENVQYRLRLRKAFEKFKEKYPSYDSTAMKEKIKSVKLLSHQEELQQIRSKLFKGGELKADYKQLGAYQRLLDLSEVSGKAKLLMRRIEDERMFAKQKSIKDVVDGFVSYVDSAVENLAKPEKLMSYLNERLEKNNPDLKSKTAPIESPKPVDVIERAQKADTVIKDYEDVIKDTQAEENAKLYHEELKKSEQFSENESALKELINCALGITNG